MFSLHKLQKFLLKHIFLVSSISQINRLLFLFLLIASPCSDCITNKYKCICKRGKSFQETFYFYFLWVNNASTSFFTHFHSINFIYTAYFAKNYFIFTSYMKYFCLWRVSIVTAITPCCDNTLHPSPSVPSQLHQYKYTLFYICRVCSPSIVARP